MGIKVAPYFLISFVPLAVIAVTPDHTDAVQPCNLLFGQISLDLSLAHTALGDQPHAKTQTAGRGIQLRNVQVAVLRIVDACFGEVVLPTGRKTGLQLLEQHPTVIYLLNDLEPLGDDLIALAVGIEPMDSLLHLALQTGNAGQTFEIINNV